MTLIAFSWQHLDGPAPAPREMAARRGLVVVSILAAVFLLVVCRCCALPPYFRQLFLPETSTTAALFAVGAEELLQARRLGLRFRSDHAERKSRLLVVCERGLGYGRYLVPLAVLPTASGFALLVLASLETTPPLPRKNDQLFLDNKPSFPDNTPRDPSSSREPGAGNHVPAVARPLWCPPHPSSRPLGARPGRGRRRVPADLSLPRRPAGAFARSRGPPWSHRPLRRGTRGWGGSGAREGGCG